MGSDRGDVVVALAEGALLLDIAGPVQVLHWAGRRVRFASPDGETVRTDVALTVGVNGAMDEFAGSVDTLVVPGYPVAGARPPRQVPPGGARGSRVCLVSSCGVPAAPCRSSRVGDPPSRSRPSAKRRTPGSSRTLMA
ncbi:hypothetical protein [Nocardia wallacei]|uniref:hypothetical protein n=1 Tax=Nocardia wallacei TaxID=480035 RepID=UPI002454C544|nr:hypothetical protein [Nocardia wallacei]